VFSSPPNLARTGRTSYQRSLKNALKSALMPRDQKELWFGPFTLSVRERRLTNAGTEVPLTPKAFDILLVLASRAGELVEKQDLIKTVWADVFVDDARIFLLSARPWATHHI
jgi:DNA-binding response OmpR family regulator